VSHRPGPAEGGARYRSVSAAASSTLERRESR
jgi:hypothetical protein